MKNKLYWLLVVVLCVSTFGVTPQKVLAQRELPLQPQLRDAPYVPGRMIVVYRNGLSSDLQAELSRNLAKTLSGTVLKVRGNAALLGVDKSFDVPGFTKEFSANIQAMNPSFQNSIHDVAYAQPNYIFDNPDTAPGTPDDYHPPQRRPNGDDDAGDPVELKKAKVDPILPTYPEDPLLFQTWGWWNTASDVVWQDKAASPMICLLDTGVDAAHPDLAGRIVNGWDVVNDDAIADDDNGHGTHVAGVIAAKQNNHIGLAGLSNSKIYAVKVLNSRGEGDSWDVGDGIRKCADNSAVKIINMSLGSYSPDSFIYGELENAIVTKGKLVIVAAGNDSTSDFTYPAAWAGDFVCQDGFYYTPPANCRLASGDPKPNTVSDGLISVGASRSYWSAPYDPANWWQIGGDGYQGGTVDGYLWVDLNLNGVEDGVELYYAAGCATGFSNFGAWVSIVAPGEDITSTVPVSYPFYQQYNLNADPDGDGYETWSGTSMAAPFVTGVAARVWSVGSSLNGGAPPTNESVKNRLISTGYPVTAALDLNTDPISWGYYSVYYQDPPATFRGEAPYCWPDASLGALYNMSNARLLNAADAMNRSTLYVYLYNAINGLPLKGTTVGAYIGTAAKSRAFMNSNFSPTAILPNLLRGKTYAIKINKTGFTNGQITIKNFTINPSDYAYLSDPSLSVGVPPMGKITGVLDWTIYSSASDLDLYTWLPQGADPVYGDGAVGYNLTGSAPFIGRGRLVDFPRARSNIEAGFDWANTESITIKPRPLFPTMPFYNTTQSRHYDFIVHEYLDGALNANPIYFRLWVGGKIKATVVKPVGAITCGPGEHWWKPGALQKDQFIVVNTCGTESLWPY